MVETKDKKEKEAKEISEKEKAELQTKENLKKTSKTFNFIFKRNNFKGHPDEDKTWIMVGHNTKNYVLEFDKLAVNVPYGVVETLRQAKYAPVTIKTIKVTTFDENGAEFQQESPEMVELPKKNLYILEMIDDKDLADFGDPSKIGNNKVYNPLLNSYMNKDINWIKGRTETEIDNVARELGVDTNLRFIKKVKEVYKAIQAKQKK